MPLRCRVSRFAMPALRRVPATTSRSLSSAADSTSPTTSTNATPGMDANSSSSEPASSSPTGYFKITLTRSAIGLPASKKATLVTLGIHRRMQTVFHPHSPEFAGKILAVKELVKVENVWNKEEVKTKEEMRRERKPEKGFEVVRRLRESTLDTL